MKKIALKLIQFYRKGISPLMANRCKYFPSCSAYTYEAIDRFGVVKGSLLGAWRILRCNPFSAGGYDPVPEKKDDSCHHAE